MTELNCFGKTEHYSDKLTLLNHYDTNENGRIDAMENMQAIADWKAGKLTQTELDIITHVWKLGEDGLSKFLRRRPPCGDYGDIDGDGWVSWNDLMYTVRHTAGFSEYPMTTDQKRRADVNGDGKVTAVDAMLMAKYIVGTYDTFAVCGKIPTTPPCTEGAYTADRVMVCRGGKWVPVSTPPAPECKEGDKKAGYVCSGGKWVPVSTPPSPGPAVPPAPGPAVPPAPGPEVPVPGAPAKYLTPDEALLRIRAGEKCYIKSTLPVLSMLPGIPYMQGIPILPGFAITTEP